MSPRSGASVLGVSGFSSGDRGVLRITNGVPDARAGFEVCAVDSDGRLHLKFIPGQVSPGAQAWLDRRTAAVGRKSRSARNGSVTIYQRLDVAPHIRRDCR